MSKRKWENRSEDTCEKDIASLFKRLKRAFGRAAIYFKVHSCYRRTWIPMNSPSECQGVLPDTQAVHSTVPTHTQSPGTLPGCYQRLLPHLLRYVSMDRVTCCRTLPPPPSPSPSLPMSPLFSSISLPSSFILSLPSTTEKKVCLIYTGSCLTLASRPVQRSAFSMQKKSQWMNDSMAFFFPFLVGNFVGTFLPPAWCTTPLKWKMYKLPPSSRNFIIILPQLLLV